MPKPINPTIGRCKCYGRDCEHDADVRKMKNKETLYLVCQDCGVIRPPGENFQEYILNNASMNGPDGASPVQEKTPEPVPEPEKKESIPKAVEAGFWSRANDQINEWFKPKEG